MKAEGDLLRVLRRGKGHRCLGRQMVRGRVNLGVDDVAGDGQRGALRALGPKWRCDEKRRRQDGQRSPESGECSAQLLLLFLHGNLHRSAVRDLGVGYHIRSFADSDNSPASAYVRIDAID